MFRKLVTIGVASVGLTSCFAVTNLDRFSQAETVNSNFVDLKFTMRGMTSHVTEYVEFRVVDSTNTLQSRGILFPLGGPDATLFAPGAIPKQNGPFHLDFFADHDQSGGYDNTPNDIRDHAWRLAIDPAKADDSNTLDVQFDHNTSFNYLNDPTPPQEYGKPATVHFTGLDGYKRIELRVSDASAKRTVAFYRIPQAPGGPFDLTVPGMIESGVDYRIEVYTDDGNGGNVRSFRFSAMGTATGLDVPFDPTTAPTATDVAAP